MIFWGNDLSIRFKTIFQRIHVSILNDFFNELMILMIFLFSMKRPKFAVKTMALAPGHDDHLHLSSDLGASAGGVSLG